MRQTDAVQMIDEQWKILHTHLSFGAAPQAKHPDSWVVDFEDAAAAAAVDGG